MKTLTKWFLMIAVLAFVTPKTRAQISVGVGINISARIAPPALPVYVQPACPVDGYLWEPGYWAYDNDADDYYWVPGVWVAPPTPGYLWTPPYWGFEGGIYAFHAGYWGPHVGFYGGINYGFGYGGIGFGGGIWVGNRFRYNTAVVNVNRTVVHNTYIDRTVIVNNNTRTSFNGRGGVEARPQPQELAAMKENHVKPTAEQQAHEQRASQNRNQFSSVNNGRPNAVAMNRMGGAHFNPQGQNARQNAGQGNFYNKQQKQQERQQRQQRQGGRPQR